MKKILKVGKLEAAQGCKVQGYLTVFGSDVEMPITLINGKNEGKTVLITGGTHGGEYPGVETAIRMATELTPENVSGQVIIVHPVNIQAFLGKSQYINPFDGKNLNRVYPGKATGTISDRIAFTISEELFTQSDFYMDLHGGDIHENLFPFVIYPTSGSDEVNRISFEASKLLGVPYMLESAGTTGTFGAAAVMGVPSFLGEIGKCGRWSEEEVLTYIKGIKNVLRYLNVIDGEVENLCDTKVITESLWNNADKTGCWYPYAEPGQIVKAGDLIGEIKDFFGNSLIKYTAEKSGVMLYLASSLPICEGDPITAIGVM